MGESWKRFRRVIARQLDGAPHETLLTIRRDHWSERPCRHAQLFAQAADVSGIVLTKLDGTRAVESPLAIARELDMPVKADRPWASR